MYNNYYLLISGVVLPNIILSLYRVFQTPLTMLNGLECGFARTLIIYLFDASCKVAPTTYFKPRKIKKEKRQDS